MFKAGHFCKTDRVRLSVHGGDNVPTASPPASSCLAHCQPSMCPSRCLLFLATLLLLIHLSLARATPVSQPAKGLVHSQNLLNITNTMLEKARETLKDYPCSAEDIDHEDITADKTSTLQACLPLELAKNESCLASRETSSITNLCLSGIYEDLKMYLAEFKAIKEKLLDHNQKQIVLDEKMLTAIEELMKFLNVSGEHQSPTSSPGGADQYRVKMKLCILLHAFRIRAMTISRVMSYLNSS
ncbi:interleukin-12 subunit alpha [Alexandromys fortis]|uniref:interleukin-12 subunit alpha n=1 Tax=Alexandromys fortis TaxID=100897 RepID=UPI0021524F17|nr:interleukin-12 subunit alpha [Microtus fortis]